MISPNLDYNCLNLQLVYGLEYKINYDQTAYAEQNGRKNPWHFQIPCKYGYIYPYSNTKLAFYCRGYKIKQRIIRELPEIELIQDGDIEGVFIFTLNQFEKIAKYARPKKRRRLSEKHRNSLLESNLRYRFKPKKCDSNAGLSGQDRLSEAGEYSDMV